MMKRRLFLAFGLLCLLASPLRAAEPVSSKPVAAKLSNAEKTEILRLEAYLNDLKNISAEFLQVGDSGQLRHGKIAISRPGKMRVDYDAPDKDFIIADGSLVHMWDDEMQQQTSVPANEGIADFILRDPAKLLSPDVIITRFAEYPAKIELSLVSAKEPDQGELTLVFEDRPLQLRQWRVLDPQGRTTGVNLENARTDVTFASNHFVFVSPKLGKTKENRN